MSRFLSVISVEEALEILNRIARPMAEERVPLSESYGRVLVKPVGSNVDIPGFPRSTVDGYAVVSSDTTGAGEAIPSMLALTGSVAMGDTPDEPVHPGTTQYIPTGAFLPAGADAVVMVEYCEPIGDQILIHRPVANGENVIFRGEDFAAGNMAIPAGTVITSRVAGVLAACGAESVSVSACPRVAIISTGNELVPVASTPAGGQIRDVNSYLCAGFVAEQGGIPVLFGIIPDDAGSLTAVLDSATATCDAILISGGSSKGERDMCADIIASRGEILVHGIALSPGKPTIIGGAGGVPVIGLPGHPASAYIVLQVIVGELFRIMSGRRIYEARIHARLKTPVVSARGREDYIRARLDGEYVVPVFGRSGLTNTLVQSDGVIRIPAAVEGYESGELVEVILWR